MPPVADRLALPGDVWRCLPEPPPTAISFFICISLVRFFLGVWCGWCVWRGGWVSVGAGWVGLGREAGGSGLVGG